MKKLLTLALILFAAPCFGESYLCIGDKATGFIYYKESNKWDTAKFDVSMGAISLTGVHPVGTCLDIDYYCPSKLFL